MIVASDAFDRGDTTGALGTLDTGQTWSEVNGNSGISSLEFYGPGSTAFPGDIAVVDLSLSDLAVQLELVTGDSTLASAAGLVVRYVDNDNFIRVALDRSGSASLQKRTSGSLSNLDTGASWSNGDLWRIELRKGSIRVKQNGTTVLSASESDHQNATKHGLFSQVSSAWRLDDWVAETVLRPTVGFVGRA